MSASVVGAIGSPKRGIGKFVTPDERPVPGLFRFFNHMGEAWLSRSKITLSSAIFELPP
jgi:hypothetical protein